MKQSVNWALLDETLDQPAYDRLKKVQVIILPRHDIHTDLLSRQNILGRLHGLLPSSKTRNILSVEVCQWSPEMSYV